MRQAKGTLVVQTFKEGILARMAHDLQLRLERFTISLDGDVVRGEFWLESLHVDGPVEGGIVRPDRFDATTRNEIERAMHKDVLHSDRHPIARYRGQALADGPGFGVRGDLELAGRTAPLAFRARSENGAYRSEIEVVPSRWGIAKYSALLGAIRVKDLVRIAFDLSDA